MNRTTITSVTGREVYTGRGFPGVEATVVTEDGSVGRAMCVAGLSVGQFEVPFEYDGGNRFEGRGVANAVNSITQKIAPKIIGMDASRQSVVDAVLIELLEDKNPSKRVGGNATASVSAAVLKAGAQSLGLPLYQHIGGTSANQLPVPGALSLVGSSRYAGGKRAFGKPSYSFIAYHFNTFSDASYALWELLRAWKKCVYDRFGLSTMFEDRVTIDAGHINNDEEIWKLMTDTIEKTKLEGKVGIQVDVASDSYYNKEAKLYEGLFDKTPKTREELLAQYKYMVAKYPFVIIEDPFEERDYEGHAILTKELDIQIVGDDLFTTNSKRLKEGIRIGAANTVLLKVNQIGTITQSSEMIQLAFQNGYGVMPCNSRGEDVDICDYSVGFGTGTIRECGLFRFGNRFLEIEKELGSRAHFAGKHGLKGRRFSLGA